MLTPGRTTFLLVILLGALNARAQFDTDNGVPFLGITYNVCSARIDTGTIRKFKLVHNDAGLPHADFIKAWKTKNGDDFLAINAGINDSVGNLVGLEIVDGKEVTPLNLAKGDGSFFYKPNGVLVITDTDIVIEDAATFQKNAAILNAVQPGPMLVANSSINGNFKQGSANKRVRAGVGIYTDQGERRLVFAIANEPVNFFDFASLFKDNFHCENALLLESSGCNMYAPRLKVKDRTGPYIISNYIVIHE